MILNTDHIKNMKFLIGKYNKGIEESKARVGGHWHLDMEAFYNNLEEVLTEKGIPYEMVDTSFGEIFQRKNTISLCYHSYGNYKNVWHIKKGYVPGFIYFDKTGYSGWSEQRYNPETNYTEKQLLNTRKLVKGYIDRNESKVDQPSWAEIPNKPYVLVLGQKPGDTVSRLAYIDTIKLSTVVNEAYKNTNITVYTKIHPCIKSPLNVAGKTINGSLHKLIADAKAIYTVNSGAGFEALFHYKQVFTSGDCEYSPATTVVKNLEDIKNTMNKEVNKNFINHFLTYCFEEHFVNTYNKKSIGKKVDRAINLFLTD